MPRAPDGVEEVPAMLSRLLEAHEIIISKVRDAITTTAETRDDGTNDLLMRFLAEYLVPVPVVES